MMVTTGGRGHELFRSVLRRAVVPRSAAYSSSLHGLEAEFASDQLDLIEVESLIDRDHEAEVLEGEPDDLVTAGVLSMLRKLADGDELVDANRLLFLFDSGLALRLHFFARYVPSSARRAPPRRVWPRMDVIVLKMFADTAS